MQQAPPLRPSPPAACPCAFWRHHGANKIGHVVGPNIMECLQKQANPALNCSKQLRAHEASKASKAVFKDIFMIFEESVRMNRRWPLHCCQ